MFTACEYVLTDAIHPGQGPDDPITLPDTTAGNDTTLIDTIISEPLMVPCTLYTHISDPKFIQGYIEFDDPLTSFWVIMVDQNRDTIFPGEEDQIPGILSDFIGQHFGGSFPVRVWQNQNATRISTIVNGTDQNTPMQLVVQVRMNGWKVYMTFSNRGLLHAGAINNIDTLLAISDLFPSARWFNLRDMGLDSISERRYMIRNLHHELCKAGEYWADFRFNNYPPDDSILIAYKLAGWENVLSAVTGNPITFRGAKVGVFKSEFVADCRGYCPTDDQIRDLLNKGFVVIADE